MLGGAALYVQKNRREDSSFPAPLLRIHYADNPSIPLSSVSIRAFYFVPQDQKGSLDPSWKELLSQALAELKEFYQFQLRETLTINYDIYPEPVIGLSDHRIYDGDNTSRGNPNALTAIHKELYTRAFTNGGDLFGNLPSPQEKNTHEVIAILYEGVGSSAMLTVEPTENNILPADDVVVLKNDERPAFLVSRSFLAYASYAEFGKSIFAHEFGHTLGLPDGYDPTTSQPTTDDLMGAGRFRPLTATYLSQETKKKLGLPY